jgi:putative transposase
MAIPHRGWTSNSTYLVTASAFDKKHLFQSEQMAGLLVEVLYHYRERQEYLLHEFVVMPDHFHLLITPALTLERALQLVKGGFSYRAKRELGFGGEIWQSSYYDRRVRDNIEYEKIRSYIRQNAVRARLVTRPENYLFSSAGPNRVLDEVPQRLKPLAFSAAGSQG